MIPVGIQVTPARAVVPGELGIGLRACPEAMCGTVKAYGEHSAPEHRLTVRERTAVTVTVTRRAHWQPEAQAPGESGPAPRPGPSGRGGHGTQAEHVVRY
eukprot:2854983-Rhodomonas_salina.1